MCGGCPSLYKTTNGTLMLFILQRPRVVHLLYTGSRGGGGGVREGVRRFERGWGKDGEMGGSRERADGTENAEATEREREKGLHNSWTRFLAGDAMFYLQTFEFMFVEITCSCSTKIAIQECIRLFNFIQNWG